MAGEWKKFRIGQLGSVVTGRTPPGTLPEYFGSVIPFVTPTDMDGRRTVRETARSLSIQGSEILKRVIVQRGVAVSCIGWQMGKAVLIDRPAATNQQINTLVPKPELADDLFVYYALTSERDTIFRLGAGGSRTPILNKSGFEAFEIPLPPLAEQKAIAAVLGALDDKIELNRRMNATLEAMARALFQSWFVDFDPVRAKLDGRPPVGLDQATAALFPNSFQDSELGHIPRGWKIQRLEEVAERVAMGPFGSSIKVSTFVDEGIPVISGQHLHDLMLEDSDFNFVAETHATQLHRSNVQRGDVVFTHAGSIGQVALIPESSQYTRYIISQRQFYMRCDRSRMLPLYIVLYFKTPEGQHRLLANTSSTGVPSIAQPVTYLRQLRLVIPPLELLARFDELAGGWLKQIAANLHQSRTLATLRDTLLPKLLSGELSVAGLESQPEIPS